LFFSIEGDFQLPARQLTPSACERDQAPYRRLYPGFLVSASVCFLGILGKEEPSPQSKERAMESASSSPAESLRKAIENLINVKLHDALAKPGGLDRLIAHRSMGVASFAVRQAERQLEETLQQILPSESYAGHDA